MIIQRLLSALLLAAGLAAAQQAANEEMIRKQVAEISRLMRESERLLLELTRTDRLVEAQRQIEEELKKLIPPEQGQPGVGGDAAAEQRQGLEQRHAEISQRLQEMLQGERDKANLTVQQLEELLKSLPRQQSQGGSGGSQPQKSAEEEKRLREREERERKQHQPRSPRQERDEQREKQRQVETQRPPDNTAAARMKRVEAWIARLPPEEQERINRNDFSRIPLRYRRLVEEYTAQRAKREAEKEADSGR